MERQQIVKISIFMIGLLLIIVWCLRIEQYMLNFYKTSPFTEKEKEKLIGYRTLCMNKYDVDTTIIEKAKEMENVIDYIDERLVSYVICLYKNWGIINADGHIDWKVTLSILSDVPQKVFNEIYSACNRTSKHNIILRTIKIDFYPYTELSGTDYERGYELFKCFLQNKVDLL